MSRIQERVEDSQYAAHDAIVKRRNIVTTTITTRNSRDTTARFDFSIFNAFSQTVRRYREVYACVWRIPGGGATISLALHLDAKRLEMNHIYIYYSVAPVRVACI